MRSRTWLTGSLTGCWLLVGACSASSPSAAPITSVLSAEIATTTSTTGTTMAATTTTTSSAVGATVVSHADGVSVVTVTTGVPGSPRALQWSADTSVRIGDVIEVSRQTEPDVVRADGAAIEPNEPYMAGPAGVLRRSDGAQPCRTTRSCWQWTAVTSGVTDLYQVGPSGLVCMTEHTATTFCAGVAAAVRRTHVTVEPDPARGVVVTSDGTGTTVAHVEPSGVLLVQLDIPGTTFGADPAVTAGWLTPTVTGEGVHAIGDPTPTVCFGDKACVAWTVNRLDTPVTIDILSAPVCSGPPCDGSRQEVRHFAVTLT